MPRARERVKVAARARLSPATMMRAALSPDLLTSSSAAAALAPAPLSLLLLGALSPLSSGVDNDNEVSGLVDVVEGVMASRLLQLRIDTCVHVWIDK